MFVTPGSRSGRHKPNNIVILAVTFDGNGSVIAAATTAPPFAVPFNCKITQVELLADVSGSIQLDVWKAPYANYPPTSSNTIVASAPPTISSATKSVDSTLNGWKNIIIAGDIIIVSVTSATTVTRVTCQFTALRT